jgi:WD40 repeat protein
MNLHNHPIILNSLFVGLIREDVKLFKLDLDYQPSKMCMNSSMDKIAVYGLDAFLRVYDLKNQRKQIETIKVDKVIGMGYVKEKLILLQPNGLILHDDATNTKLPMADLVGKTFKEFFINAGSNDTTFYISTDNALLLYQYKNGEALQLIKSIAVNHSSNFKKGKSEVFFSADNQLFSTSDNGLVVQKILTIENNITAISSPLISGLIAVGDEQGNIYLIDPKTFQIKSERNKLHLSKISGLEVLHTQGGTEILLSTGLDWALNIFYLTDLQSNSSVLPSPITLREHKGWITNLLINNNSNQALTSSYDRTIRFWPLLPEQLIYNSTIPTSNKKNNTNE